jgi:eukaryotic-like serine/threonine-protein kinase
LLLKNSDPKMPNDWSPDGQFLLYRSRNQLATANMDLWILPVRGNRQPFPYLNMSATEDSGQFSPDGRWIAYESDASGRREVYVRPFRGMPAGTEGQWQVSTAGGTFPRWRADGRELYFVDPAGRMMAAAVTTVEARFEAGTPAVLFQTSMPTVAATNSWQYDVARDGRFSPVTAGF